MYLKVSPLLWARSCSAALLRSSVSPLRPSGFTLIETMVVVAIVAILAALAAPSFSDLIRNNRVSAASSALQVSLNLARSEAVKRGTDARVTVAASQCTGSGASTACKFEKGWTVFFDKTNNANGDVAPTADSSSVTRLEVVAAPSAPVSFGQNGLVQSFTYNGQGRLIDVTGAGVVARSAWFYDASSDKYCLVSSNTGRIRATRVVSASNCPTS